MPNAESKYWPEFWSNHAQSALHADRQSQVLRTFRGQPISNATFQQIVGSILEKLAMEHSHDVLDLCCGNGVITHCLAETCNSIRAVDVSADLVGMIDTIRFPKIHMTVSDIRQVEFEPESFDRVLLYAGLQYLSYVDTLDLLANVIKWLRPGGLFFIGDIPNLDRRWNFFRSETQRFNYFSRIAQGKPIIGTWFQPTWLRHAAEYTGFQNVEILNQSQECPYEHFRFDVICKKQS